jgi:Rieske Fe-S protein
MDGTDGGGAKDGNASDRMANDPRGIARRTVLGAVAVVGAGSAAALLAACGDDSTASSPTTTPTEVAAPGATTASGVLVAADAVPVGGGVVELVGDRKYVVTQPVAGEYKAFSAVCTHEGCTVAGVSAGQILCPCHNSRFDAATGAVLGGPAPAPLAEVSVAQDGDDIVFA